MPARGEAEHPEMLGVEPKIFGAMTEQAEGPLGILKRRRNKGRTKLSA